MASRKPTTTPSNKHETSKLPKERKARKSKGNGADEPILYEDLLTGKPLQTTLGEVVKSKRNEREIPREVRLENYVKRLPCILSAEQVKCKLSEIKDLRRQKSREDAVLVQLKSDYDKAKKDCESRLAQAESALSILLDETCDGIEYKDVACQRVWDYPLIQVREYRTDRTPLELIGEPRPMNNAELQMPTLDQLAPSDLTTNPGKSYPIGGDSGPGTVPINNEADHDDEPPADMEVKY
jgi:hypothetical protein